MWSGTFAITRSRDCSSAGSRSQGFGIVADCSRGSYVCGYSADGVFELEDLVEKPGISEAPSNLAVAARYVFSPRIFDYLEKSPPGVGGEIQLTDAIRMLIHDGRKVLGVRPANIGRRLDVGTFEDYFLAFTEFALADPVYGPALRSALEELLQIDLSTSKHGHTVART